MALVYFKYKEGWQLKGDIIVIYTSPFFAQREQGLIISLLREIDTVRRV